MAAHKRVVVILKDGDWWEKGDVLLGTNPAYVEIYKNHTEEQLKQYLCDERGQLRGHPEYYALRLVKENEFGVVSP